MKQLKKSIYICFGIVVLMLENSPVSALRYTDVPANIPQQKLTNAIAYVEGGSPFSENGITYYNGGSIIELIVSLPSNSYAIGVSNIVNYDQNQLELITSFNEIRNTLAATFINTNWSSYVSKYNGENSQIMIVTSANNYLYNIDVSGGVIARLRFRVKEQAATSKGVNINIQFQYNIAGVMADGTRTYIHAGYNPANDNATYMVNAPTIILPAHKTPEPTPSIPNPSQPLPSKPYDPSIQYHPDIVKEIVNNAIDEEKSIEMIEIITAREYTFDTLKERLSGRNTVQKILQLFKQEKNVNTEKHKTYHFTGTIENNTAIAAHTHVTCYRHYSFIGLSFLMLIATYIYKKYLETKRKILWRNA